MSLFERVRIHLKQHGYIINNYTDPVAEYTAIMDHINQLDTFDLFMLISDALDHNEGDM